MHKVISVLFGAAFTVAACWAAGRLLISRLRLELYREEERLFAFVAGSACWSMVVFLLCSAGLVREVWFLACGLPLMVAAWRVKTPQRVPLPDFQGFYKLLFGAVMLTFGVLYVVNAMAPETSPDGATYHLGLVARYFRQHGFGRITTDMYANLSEGVEMLFLSAFQMGRHSAAALVEFAFLVALPFAILSYSRRFGFPRAGVFGAVLVFASPVFGIAGTSAYNDAAGACVLFCLFYVLQIWRVERQHGWLVLAGLMAGFCYGIKYTLFPAVPYALGLVLWELWRARKAGWMRQSIRPLGMLAGCAALMMVPWMAKNWITVENPFSPFANRYFPNPYVTVTSEEEYIGYMRYPDGVSQVRRPLTHTIDGAQVGGVLGPVFLLAPLALLALRFAAGRQLLLAAGLFALPAFTNAQTRFLMPAACFLGPALGLALMNARGVIPLLLMTHAVISWPWVLGRYCDPYAWRLRDFPLAEALRQVPEDQALTRRLPGYRTADLINKKTPKGARVFTLSQPPEAYIDRDLVIAYESAEGWRLRDILLSPLMEDWQPKRRLVFPFAARSLRRVRVVQTGSDATDQWSISELRLYEAGEELTREAIWRLRASPNPWDVQLAFDNNPMTRWRSQEHLRNGMWMEVDLGAARMVDRVAVECPHDARGVRVKLEGEVAAGVWATLAAEPTASDQALKWDLRRAAIVEIKRRGITHLLMASDDFGVQDLRAQAKAWGIESIGSVGDSELFRLR